MEYILVIAFGVGLLLFLLSWLRVIFAGFRHHSFTGLVSILPVINLLVLPTIWHRVYGWVMTGLIGLLVAIASWFAGADQRVYRYTAEMGVDIQPGTVVADGQLAPPQKTLEFPVAASPVIATQPAAPLPSGKELPKSALYHMAYKPVAPGSLGQHQGQYIRITQQDRRRYEGKLLDFADNSLTIERRMNGGLVAYKVNLNEIDSAEVMVRE